jgi:hypothetical protein
VGAFGVFTAVVCVVVGVGCGVACVVVVVVDAVVLGVGAFVAGTGVGPGVGADVGGVGVGCGDGAIVGAGVGGTGVGCAVVVAVLSVDVVDSVLLECVFLEMQSSGGVYMPHGPERLSAQHLRATQTTRTHDSFQNQSCKTLAHPGQPASIWPNMQLTFVSTDDQSLQLLVPIKPHNTTDQQVDPKNYLTVKPGASVQISTCVSVRDTSFS